MFSHGTHAWKVRVRSVLPRNSRNSQKVRVRGVLPRNARNVRGCSSLCCTNRVEMYCLQKTLRRVWHPCHTHATCHDRILPQMAQINTDGQGARYPTECTERTEVSCCGRMQWQLGWCSSCLVGAVETTAPPGRVRGYGRMPYPPTIAQTGRVS